MMTNDRPPDSIIEDDAALDAFMKNYFEEREREATASRERKRKDSGKIASAWDHQEVIVTKSNPISGDVKYSEPKESSRNKDRTDFAVKKKG